MNFRAIDQIGTLMVSAGKSFTPQKLQEIVTEFRRHAARSCSYCHGIPVLPKQQNLATKKRAMLFCYKVINIPAEMLNKQGYKNNLGFFPVTKYVFRKDTGYLAAVVIIGDGEEHIYEFDEGRLNEKLLQHSKFFPYQSNYFYLLGTVDERSLINFSRSSIQNAFVKLSEGLSARALGMIVVVICESSRFHPLFRLFRRALHSNGHFNLDYGVWCMINDWGRGSRALLDHKDNLNNDTRHQPIVGCESLTTLHLAANAIALILDAKGEVDDKGPPKSVPSVFRSAVGSSSPVLESICCSPPPVIFQYDDFRMAYKGFGDLDWCVLQISFERDEKPIGTADISDDIAALKTISDFADCEEVDERTVDLKDKIPLCRASFSKKRLFHRTALWNHLEPREFRSSVASTATIYIPSSPTAGIQHLEKQNNNEAINLPPIRRVKGPNDANSTSTASSIPHRISESSLH